MTEVYIKFEANSEVHYVRLASSPFIIGTEHFFTPFHSILVADGQPPKLNLHSPADSQILSAVGNDYNMVLNDGIDNDLPEEGIVSFDLKVGDIITIMEANRFVKITRITIRTIFL